MANRFQCIWCGHITTVNPVSRPHPGNYPRKAKPKTGKGKIK